MARDEGGCDMIPVQGLHRLGTSRTMANELLPLTCAKCGSCVVSEQFSPRILHGDLFYEYRCAACTVDRREFFQRLPISWTGLLQLVLYHLWTRSGRRLAYFRWREDICDTIAERWDDLIPSRQKTHSWKNSVSSVLSAHSRIFASGMEAKGMPGWWGLHVWEPPTVRQSPRPVKDETDAKRVRHDQPDPLSESDSIDQNVLVDEDSTSHPPEDHGTEDHGTEDHDGTRHQLLERLLMMDSSLLQAAIKKAKAKQSKQEREREREMTREMARERKTKLAAIPRCNGSLVAPTDVSMQHEQTILVPFMPRYPPDAPVIRASPYENDLLKKCNRIHPSPPNVTRLRRKLLVRRQRRRANLPLFDIDTSIYLFLKRADRPLFLDSHPGLAAVTEEEQPVPPSPSTLPALHDVPFIRDPALSLYSRLTGMRALYGASPYPVTSPLTGRLLPQFVLRDHTCRAPKLRLLRELRDTVPEAVCLRGHNYDDSDDSDDDSDSSPRSDQESIDYCHVRREYIGQINDLLRMAFWPGIDMTETLDYPDYTLIALHRHSVVGCVFVTPDGYLSYLHVRPDFQGAGIARHLLGQLLPVVSPRKDVTLHVAVTNASALLLYQQFGFKPEEFVVDFYHKYYPVDYTEQSRNAFFMRLRR